MSVKQPPVYVYTLMDTPGVVAANTFISFFNPANSGKVMFAIQGSVTTYSSAAAGSANSMGTYRISAASGGTLIAASTVYRVASFWPDPGTEIRIGNPTNTVSSLPLAVFPPVISSGGGGDAVANISAPTNPGSPFFPGEGFIFKTLGGDVDQVWNITFIFSEASI
jgi:hypothetical protein